MAEEDRMEGTDYQLRSARDHRASGILGKAVPLTSTLKPQMDAHGYCGNRGSQLQAGLVKVE